MSRALCLFAYDVCDPKRLRRVRRHLIGFRVGGQKSVFECWLTPAELVSIRRGLADLIEPDADRVHVLALDPRMKPHCFGVARSFAQPAFMIL